MQVEVKPFRLYVKGFSREDEPWVGTLLTLSNGRIAVRGELELEPFDTGTLYAGYYLDVPLWRRELAQLPRINGVYVLCSGEPARPKRVERELDLREGLLKVRASLSCAAGSLSYTSTSAVHRRLKSLYMQRVELEGCCGSELLVTLPIELASNPFVAGASVRHFDIASFKFDGAWLSVLLEPRRGGKPIALMSFLKSTGCSALIPVSSADALGFLVTGCSRRVTLERYVFVGETPWREEPLWDSLLQSHKAAWRELWEKIGLEVEGDDRVAGAITFYTYHLLQLIDEDSDSLMIPSRGLHGFGYRGHIFWDTDLYLALFLSALYPEAAKKVLKFRCKTLEAARAYAAQSGYRGARYPWESVDDGFEATPRHGLLLKENSCQCIDILTGEKEIHITADVAFAVDLYYRLTGDTRFMAECGLRILVESARFWASRVAWDPDKSAYVIKDVIGPDEYHVGVDNDYFTNVMAKLNLERAARYVEEALSSESNPLRVAAEDLGVTRQEVEKWKEIAGRIFEGGREGLVVEQFEGYFDLEEGQLNPSYAPVRVPVEELEKLSQLKVIKQADVVLALLIQDLVSGVPKEVLEANYRYYLPRTTHESSLSLPIYAAVAISLKDEYAGVLFSKVLDTDLGNLYGNTGDGFHVGAAGGLWYAILYGLLGLRLSHEELRFKPSCIDGIRRLSVNISYRGARLKVDLRCDGEPLLHKSFLT
ncbi:MAG: hypothetical protein QW407_01500 [Thermofilaceae archaeon]